MAAAASPDRDRDASDAEDQALVEAARGGDRQACGTLFEKYRERVFAVLIGVLGHREDALEATQEVFLKVFRALPRYDPRARFFTWLYRIAVNQGIDRIRQRRTRRELTGSETDESWESRWQPVALPESQPAARAERAEIAERIEGALRQLSEDHRTVLWMFAREGLSYAEIAEVLEIPVGTVMSRLFYARKRLRELLPPEFSEEEG